MIYAYYERINERSESDANQSARQKYKSTAAWVKDLQPEDVQYLESLPYTISVPLYNVIVVHAGLVPGVPVNSQRPVDMTTMKDVRKRGDKYFGADNADGPWAHAWNGPEHVYFGHNARRGLQADWLKHPFATGLDTGCVKGHRLTGAVVKSANQKPVLISVPAKQVYSPQTK